MIRDIHEFIEPGHEAEFDLVIAGAGPAGISVALQFIGSGYRVALLEAGGLSSAGADDLRFYDGENADLDYPIAASRQRFFGGTSNHWGGWCRPLEEVDMRPREWLETTAWPIERSALDTWYAKAHDVLEMDLLTYEVNGQVESSRLLPADSSSGFVNRLFRFSPPTRFGSVYRQVLEQSEEIHVLLHAPLVELEHENGQISACRVRNARGEQFLLRTAVVVLAMGGLEVPRLLLHTASAASQALGDESGWLGRGFMEHHGYTPGFLLTKPRLQYELHQGPEARQLPVLAPRPELLQSERLMNFCMTLTPVEPGSSWSPTVMRFPGLAPALVEEPWRYRLTMINEPSPNRESRVSLSDQVDPLGMRRIRLHWRIAERDLAGIARIIRRLAEWVGRAGLGRIQFSRPVSPETTRNFGTGMHHMGTTRMSADPADGVVDANCRVHGTDNLFVASSSVFPTAGYANPTLTIVALALRLAAHLREKVL